MDKIQADKKNKKHSKKYMEILETFNDITMFEKLKKFFAKTPDFDINMIIKVEDLYYNGLTPLGIAFRKMKPFYIVKLLLEQGASPNCCYNRGISNTPLIIALIQDEVFHQSRDKKLALVLEHGADPNAIDTYSGQTALEIMRKKKKEYLTYSKTTSDNFILDQYNNMVESLEKATVEWQEKKIERQAVSIMDNVISI